MQGAARNRDAFARSELDRPVFEVQDQGAFQDEEELVLLVVAVPVSLTSESD
jgi:hypothetical protein